MLGTTQDMLNATSTMLRRQEQKKQKQKRKQVQEETAYQEINHQSQRIAQAAEFAICCLIDAAEQCLGAFWIFFAPAN